MSAQKRSAEDDGQPTRLVRRKRAAILDFSSGQRKIIVGEDDEQNAFDIHTGLLVKHSAYFKAIIENEKKAVANADEDENAAKKAEKEPTAPGKNCKSVLPGNNPLELPDEDPELFELFGSFLYNGYLCSER